MYYHDHHCLRAVIIAIIAACNCSKNLVTSLVPRGLATRLCYYWTRIIIDIRVTDSVSAPLMYSCDCRVQLLCEPSLSQAHQ